MSNSGIFIQIVVMKVVFFKKSFGKKFFLSLGVFFIARKSSHRFSSPEEASKVLIDNYQPRYEGAPSFYSVYYFNETKRDATTLYVSLKDDSFRHVAQDNLLNTRQRDGAAFHYHSSSRFLVILYFISVSVQGRQGGCMML